MILLSDKMDILFQQTDFTFQNKYDNRELNKILNYWLFLDEKATEVQKLTGETMETVLYSKYYWSSRFIECYIELYGMDAGLEQEKYKILDEMDRELSNGINWDIIKKLEEGKS